MDLLQTYESTRPYSVWCNIGTRWKVAEPKVNWQSSLEQLSTCLTLIWLHNGDTESARESFFVSPSTLIKCNPTKLRFEVAPDYLSFILCLSFFRVEIQPSLSQPFKTSHIHHNKNHSSNLISTWMPAQNPTVIPKNTFELRTLLNTFYLW